MSRNGFAYILDSFPVLRKYEERDYGESRTKWVALAYYGAYEREEWEACIK